MLKNKKQLLPIIWFSGFFFGFFLIDLFTKHFLFDYHNIFNEPGGKVEYQNALFGIRSIKHDNSTLFSSLNWNSPLWLRLLINLTLATLATSPIFFTKSIGQNIALGIIVAGILGNTTDIIFTKGNFVKDIIFIPWSDHGTFNFADVWMVIGAFTFLVVTIVKGVRSKK